MSQPSSGQCPICGRPRDTELRPFCSKRCADIDLARWLKGEYSIPGAPLDAEESLGRIEEDPDLH